MSPPTAQELLQHAEVLGDGALAEVGVPTHAIRAHGLIVVAGSLGHPQWLGRELRRIERYRVVVYTEDGLERVAAISTNRYINALAMSRNGQSLAIGCGGYDGGYLYRGELILLDIQSGESRSMLSTSRTVTDVCWLEDALEFSLAPTDSEATPQLSRFALDRAQFLGDERSIDVAQLEPLELIPLDSPHNHWEATDTSAIDDLSLTPNSRRQVWDVDVDDDGVVLASLDGVRLERWDADGSRSYAVPTEGVGCQLVRTADAVIANTVIVRSAEVTSVGDWDKTRSHIAVFEPESGSVISEFEEARTSVLIAAGDSVMARDVSTRRDNEGSVRSLVSDDPGFSCSTRRYDIFNSYLRIKGSPDPLVSVGRGSEPYDEPWLVKIDPGASGDGENPHVRDMFPLEWEEDLDRRVVGTVGCYDDSMSSLILGCEVRAKQAAADEHFVVRRSATTGEALWSQRVESQLVGVECVGRTVFAAMVSGWLMLLDRDSGEVMSEARIEVGGFETQPMSLSVSADWLSLGLVDGRILRCSTR